MSGISSLLKQAERNKSSSTQKRFSLDIGPAKKLPKKQVDPNAIKALLDRQEKDKQQERSKLITKAVEYTKRDEVNYKDKHGLRKVEQEHSEKCKKQWLKIQKEKREFIERMNKAAEERDKNKKARDVDEVITSLKQKDAVKRKRKYEVFEGGMEKKHKKEFNVLRGPVITDMNELLRIAQKNAESDAFGSMTNPMNLLERKDNNSSSQRLQTSQDRKETSRSDGIASLPKIPKVGQSKGDSKKSSSKDHSSSKHKDSTRSSKSSNGSKHSKDHRDRKSNNESSSSSSRPSKPEKSKSKPDQRSSRPSEPGSSSSTTNGSTSSSNYKSDSRNGESSQKSNGESSSSSNGVKKPSNHSSSVNSSKLYGKPSNGTVSSMADVDKAKLREHASRQLELLRAERQKLEEREQEERRKRIMLKRARQAEEEQLKKRLQALRSRRKYEDEYDEDVDDYEDEDEYEDDFIDDAPIDDPYAKNYSKHIAEIYKYDRRKYIDEDDADIQESSFSQCMAEEARSARLGRQEDLEDMRKEEEELRRKNASKEKKLQELAKKFKQKKKLTLCPV